MRKQVVNIPSYIVRLDSQKHIDFSLKSPLGGGRPGELLVTSSVVALLCFDVRHYYNIISSLILSQAVCSDV